MSKKHKKICRVLNYIEHRLIAISIVTGSVSISVCISLVGTHIGMESSTIALKMCVVTTRIKKYKSIIQKKKKKHEKIVLLTKSKLNSIEVLIAKTLIDSNINRDEFVLINSALKEFYDMIEEIKNSNYK